MKSDEVSKLLAQKFQRESARLKSWGTKTDDKAALSFAMAVTDFVRALMADARSREVRRLLKKYDVRLNDHSHQLKRFYNYMLEREHATKVMSKAIKNFATDKENKRQWKHKEHHEHKHKHKHSH